MQEEKVAGKEKEIRFRNEVDLPSTTFGTFALYRYPAKFIPHIIAYVLEKYGHPHMKVFDPFAGYGTVGVVSKIYGYDYELWDLNPMLEKLHTIATLKPREVNVKELLRKMTDSDKEFKPDWSNLDYWYVKDFLPLLFKVWGFYHHSLNDEYLKLLLTIPLLNATRYFSLDDMQRQKLSKSPISENRMVSLLTGDWRIKFFEMVEKELRKVIRGIVDNWTLLPKPTRAIVKGGVDTFTMSLEEEKDILITSPPYLQSQEYIRQAKMDLFWLKHPEGEIRRLGKLEIPYREVEPCHIYSRTFSLIRNEIQEDHLRRIFDRYFWGVVGSLTRLSENIGSYLFLFVGRASVRGRPVPIDRIFAEHFEELGWVHEVTLVDTIVSRRMFLYKKNPATNRKDKRTKTENLVVLKRE